MKIAANFVIGGIVFTSLIVGGAILGAVAVYGLCKDEIDAGREALANRSAREEYQKNACQQKTHLVDYAWGYDQYKTNKSEENKE